MNEKNLFGILSEIDEKYILEAAEYEPSLRRRLYNRRAIAAILAIAIVVGSITLLGQVVLSTERFDIKGIASHIAELNQVEHSEIIFEDQGITITSSEVQAKILGLQSSGRTYSDDEITEAAIKDILTRKAMLIKAKENGYSVSEEEYQAFKQKFIDGLETAENRDETQEFLDGFGGVEEYFAEMKDTICDGFTIRKYLDDLEAEYAKEKGMDIVSYDFYTLWLEKEEQINEEAYEELNISSEELQAIAVKYEMTVSDIEEGN